MSLWHYIAESKPSDGTVVWARLSYPARAFEVTYREATQDFIDADGFTFPWYMVRTWREIDLLQLNCYWLSPPGSPDIIGTYTLIGYINGYPYFRNTPKNKWLWFSWWADYWLITTTKFVITAPFFSNPESGDYEGTYGGVGGASGTVYVEPIAA